MKAQPISQWLSEDNCPNRLISWGSNTRNLNTLRQDVTALYRHLETLGQTTRSASRWALCFEDSYFFCVALLATLHAGKTPVIPGHCREAQLQEQQSLFDGVLTDLPLNLTCPCWQVASSNLEMAATAHASLDTPLPAIPADAALVMFTSGSTGMPQQVTKPVAVMDLESQWLAFLWADKLQSCIIRASVSHQHLYGLTFRLWLPMSLGLPFDCKQVEFPEQLANSPRCALISSPAFLQRLDGKLPAPDCHFVVSAGGPLHFNHAEQVMRWLNIAPNEIYGCTETGIMAWRNRKTDDALWVKFKDVSFFGDEEENLRVFSPLLADPAGLVLDDHVDFDDHGNFTLLGRRDRSVKIEEKRISLSEIERRLCEINEITDAAALLIRRGNRNHIGVVVVLKQEAHQHYRQQGIRKFSHAWRAQLKPLLEPVALPRYWRVIEAIPLNAQSKRSWPALQELFDETH
ncbi:AMP-binding protein [Xenorhabdus szentirmaii]|uniref:AMP-dependent synthetase and ligase n=1 Tax=Xenorhabdus szentirmaii DSM 16338 TaxID=1427518 RepID=W1IV79_9GAMM|nr:MULTISPECIES: AMP-binding protein [Xenorhabdus]MBD2779300.1 AMP-binding protein [Xenorhabdus sp. 38]PHM34948.1 putative hybrid polyketide-non-ribosomal peptide synthetase [Xenorhabdus szentirmaii DSM 16338]PHM43705.1 putative hybrid polyketide-non-ribosomal peptide synthetase [Xenorhabdus szentirmaii]CDL82354.1 AMP-dependent synthetase and ligase [Xenorhabdus szentirmaii DSM 16338]